MASFYASFALVAASLLTACGHSEPSRSLLFTSRPAPPTELSFAVHPLHNPGLTYQLYEPLIDYLNSRVQGVTFHLVSSRDYDAYQHRLAAHEFDFALPNPYQAVMAQSAGYRVFGKVAGDEDFRGLILTRRGSPITRVTDLRGKSIAYPAATAVAAAMQPQLYLQTHGVPLRQTRTVYVGSMESALESVRSGATDAAAVWPDPWRKYQMTHPAEARTLEVKWTTPHLVNNALIARRAIPRAVVDRVLRALTELSHTSNGRKLLASLSTDGFEPATDATYDPVRAFLRRFSAEVRPLDLPDEKKS